MTFLIARRFTGDRVQKPIGSERETRIPNFFMQRPLKRRKQNTILGIWDNVGNWCGDQDSIARASISYFEELYTTAHPSQTESVIAPIPALVTPEMNSELSRAFTREDVVMAFKQLYPTKSPGPDGMSALFFLKILEYCRH